MTHFDHGGFDMQSRILYALLTISALCATTTLGALEPMALDKAPTDDKTTTRLTPATNLGRCAPLLGAGASLRADQADWPGVAALEQGDHHAHSCNALMVTPEWALTLDFCIPESGADGFRITAHGAAGEVSGSVTEIVREPESASLNKHQRLVMLKLETPMEGVVPVGFSDRQIDAAVLSEGACAVLVGSGHTSRHSDFGFHQVPVPVVGALRCAASLNPVDDLDGRSLCTGYHAGGADGCTGFAGGAVMMPVGRMGWRAVGLVAWGRGCGEPGEYTVSTRVAPARDWIDGIVSGQSAAPSSDIER